MARRFIDAVRQASPASPRRTSKQTRNFAIHGCGYFWRLVLNCVCVHLLPSTGVLSRRLITLTGEQFNPIHVISPSTYRVTRADIGRLPDEPPILVASVITPNTCVIWETHPKSLGPGTLVASEPTVYNGIPRQYSYGPCVNGVVSRDPIMHQTWCPVITF